MPATPTDLFAFLDRLGIHYSTVSHQPLFTPEESRALRGTIPGGHTKNLVLKEKSGAYYLVVACADAVIDLKGLHRQLGATGGSRSARPTPCRSCWGSAPGRSHRLRRSMTFPAKLW
jgi:Ala-tRNA(Pro) deacylase